MNTQHKFDNRYIALKRGLNQLNNNQLKEILYKENHKQILCDNYNYDEKLKLWCPLAIGLKVDKKIGLYTTKPVTNDLAKKIITMEGKKYNICFNLNPLRGIKGDFFSTNRIEDLLKTCEDILIERN